MAQRAERAGGALVAIMTLHKLHAGDGYTARAQGRTVDTAHVITGDTMTREALYVPLTRGRDATRL